MPPPRRQWLASGGACMPAEAPGCVAAVYFKTTEEAVADMLARLLAAWPLYVEASLAK